jgi:hypothetical protein
MASTRQAALIPLREPHKGALSLMGGMGLIKYIYKMVKKLKVIVPDIIGIRFSVFHDHVPLILGYKMFSNYAWFLKSPT